MSDKLTFGVEEEFFVVDAEGHLSRAAADVIEAADDVPGELQKELTRAQAETATGVCDDPAGLLGQLHAMRSELATAAAGRDLRVVAGGAPPMAEDSGPGITPGARYQRMAEHFGATAHSATTCGCHVHVAIPDPEAGIKVIDHVRHRLPALLALAANSSIAGGVDTGYCSWRYQQWTRWPSAGPPPHFTSVDHYESIIDGWLRAGAILDRGMVYWDIRLSDNQPTVEFRVADVARAPEDAVLLAVLARALVHSALDESAKPPELSNEVLRGQLWRAARDGLAGRCPHPVTGDLVPSHLVLDDLLGYLTPALEAAGDRDFAEEGLARLRAHGNGADCQRAVFERTGRAADVVDLLTVKASPG